MITQDFFMNSFPSWNALEQIPDWIPELDPNTTDIYQLELADLYIRLEGHYPNNQFSQFNTRLDDNQTFYYEAMGGEGGAEGWSEKMLTSIERIEANTTKFAAFMPESEQHCILPFANFYTIEADGVLLVDWLDAMINDQPIDTEACPLCVAPNPP